MVETGGKQYRVAPGEVVTVERLLGGIGDTVYLDRVLALNDEQAIRIGTPLIAGARVRAKILTQGRGTKVTVFKFRRREKYRRTIGHRQELTRLQIEEIIGGS